MKLFRKPRSRVRDIIVWFDKDRIIQNNIRKNKDVVYGGRAIQAQIGPLARPTRDWDVFSKHPKKRALEVERKLDRESGRDIYYTIPSKQHKGTYKVYHKGPDLRKGTKDDVGIIDYTKSRRIKTTTINGIKHAKLSEVIKDKRRALSNKAFAFRHEKDQEDINRIKLARRVGWLGK